MVGAPFLAIEMLGSNVAGQQVPQVTTDWAAIADVVYMLGWMCSIYALLRAGAAGERKWANIILKTQLILLGIANIYNLWGATGIGTDSIYFQILDLSWPISNAFMLATGIAIIKADVLRGWQKYAALVVGFWLPVGMLVMMLFGRVNATLYFGVTYSILAWGALAIVAYKAHEPKVVYNRFGIPEIA
ncbi:hypothetical protein BC343_10860 [Mucilaginibacter pedocola]|uniref:Uncharacterized protein n=2 Tax=Mucilaginibacter pedocola TaxID=1792845 RepID=A0A1S9PAY7_9SPHI|nr:hypothetical protein BC343_10860 [Mucilaginibacter pedocola]